MAQNITLLGASYADVPSVTLPKTGGGTASFTDVSDTTSTASDVVAGTYFYTAAGNKTQGTITSRTSTDLSASGATVTAPAGYYASAATKTISSGSATASASKGAVSNHSITVTPSVTRTAGYITAGSANGTAVTVSASELVSGSETKTANGTYDVTNLASLVVSVPIVTYYTGSSDPSASLGANGDIYLKTGV